MEGKTIVRIVAALLLLGVIVFALINREAIDFAQLENWVQRSGWAAPVLFVLVYAVVTVLFLPGSVLTLAGGALFGPWFGTLYNIIGATLGATIAFVIARYLGSEWVSRKAGGKLKQLIDGVEEEGWRFIAFVRLVPLFPFNLLNYALGLTRIALPHYVIASFIFMLPGTFAYTWLGHAGREAVAGEEGFIRTVLLALALLAAVIFLPKFVMRFRQASAN